MPTIPFAKGNQHGKKSAGKPKKPTKLPTKLLEGILEKFDDATISNLIDELNPEKKLQLFIKVSEMLLKRENDKLNMQFNMVRLRQLEYELKPLDNQAVINIGYIDNNNNLGTDETF